MIFSKREKSKKKLFGKKYLFEKIVIGAEYKIF